MILAILNMKIGPKNDLPKGLKTIRFLANTCQNKKNIKALKELALFRLDDIWTYSISLHRLLTPFLLNFLNCGKCGGL